MDFEEIVKIVQSSKDRQSQSTSSSSNLSSTEEVKTPQSRQQKSSKSIHGPSNKVHGIHNSFKGEMLLYPEQHDNVRKLTITLFLLLVLMSLTYAHVSVQAVDVFDAGVFCDSTTWHQAENATSATVVARRLLEGVFTRSALLKCSVTGLPP